MPKEEVDIPDRLDIQIARLVDDGEFLDREEAVRELLRAGVRAYQSTGDAGGADAPDTQDDLMGHDDEYVF